MGGDTSKHRLYMSEDPEKMRDNTREHYTKMVVRLQDEIERLLKLYVFQREALETEMYDGMGYKKLTADEKFVKKLKELTIGMNSLVESRIKWDRAQAKMAESMTPTQEMDAVCTYLAALDADAWGLMKDRMERRGIKMGKI